MNRFHPQRALAALAATLLLATLPARAADLVLPSEVPASHWKTSYLNQFADEVKKRTNGALNVKVFPGAQLYNEQDAMAALGTGAVHMVWPLAARLETVEPRTGIINLPFMLNDELMQNRCFADGVGKLLSAYVEPRKLLVLGMLRTADLLFLFKSKDIRRLEDMKGSKVRVTGGKVFLDMVRSLNASPVSLPASEMSTALSQGAIDGVLSSPAAWSEIVGITAKYAWYVPGLATSTYAVVVDKTWFEALPAEQRKVLVEVIDEIARRQWKETMDADKKLIDKMIAQGGVYRVADAAEIKRWRELGAVGSKVFTDKYPEALQKITALEKGCTGGR